MRQKDFHDRLVCSQLPPFLTVPTPTLDLWLGQQLALLIAVGPLPTKGSTAPELHTTLRDWLRKPPIDTAKPR